MTAKRPLVPTKKTNPSFMPSADTYPHYRLIPLKTDKVKKFCLYLFVSPQHYLLLIPSAPRYAVIRRLALWMENAPYEVFETIG